MIHWPAIRADQRRRNASAYVHALPGNGETSESQGMPLVTERLEMLATKRFRSPPEG